MYHYCFCSLTFLPSPHPPPHPTPTPHQVSDSGASLGLSHEAPSDHWADRCSGHSSLTSERPTQLATFFLLKRLSLCRFHENTLSIFCCFSSSHLFCWQLSSFSVWFLNVGASEGPFLGPFLLSIKCCFWETSTILWLEILSHMPVTTQSLSVMFPPRRSRLQPPPWLPLE